MHRLFVALRPSPSVRETLLDMMEGVPGARWQGDDQLHLTLRFVGEVERPMAEDIAVALAGVTAPRPTVALRGVGTFAAGSRVHTLWAGAADDPGLTLLHHKIGRALLAVGVPPERRAFHPHVTLARFGRTAPPVAPFLLRHATFAAPAVMHDAFILYESHLGRDGAHYAAVARFPLG